MKRTPFRFVVPALFVIMIGCTSTFKGVEAEPGFTYLRSHLAGTIGAALPKLERATEAAMEELDFVAVEVVSDKLRGEIRSKMADGTKVTVHLIAQDFETTVIRIRVGLFGDQSVSVQILRHIQKQLGQI